MVDLTVFYRSIGQITHVTIFHQTIIQSHNISPTWASSGTHRSPNKRNVAQLNNRLMKNCDMRNLSKDETHPNRSGMSKNFYNHTTWWIPQHMQCRIVN